jgi:hypothetical protein
VFNVSFGKSYTIFFYYIFSSFSLLLKYFYLMERGSSTPKNRKRLRAIKKVAAIAADLETG